MIVTAANLADQLDKDLNETYKYYDMYKMQGW
jgi:hypothetical protein